MAAPWCDGSLSTNGAVRSGELRNRAELSERGVERVGPWPAGREPERESAVKVHDPGGDGDQSGAEGTRDGELIVGVDVTESGVPADQVVGEDRTCQPCCVGGKVPGRDVFESGSFFEITDRESHDSVLTVEPIDGDGVVCEVGQERVVSPVRPQFGLVLVGEAGPSHDQTPTLIHTHSPTCASPSDVYPIGTQAFSSIVPIAFTIAVFAALTAIV